MTKVPLARFAHDAQPQGGVEALTDEITMAVVELELDAQRGVEPQDLGRDRRDERAAEILRRRDAQRARRRAVVRRDESVDVFRCVDHRAVW
jgi:hypothetical protein